jgi:methionyl-tRNA formyltransferase
MDPKGIRIVFMGTPEFAVESLKALVEGGYSIVAVITAPDKPSGRGQKIAESPVKQYAREKGIEVLQPEKLKNPEFLSALATLKADLQIVVAFRMLPEAVWSMPPLGTFNLHASLLPQYRGAAPLNRAIMNGEQTTGITTFLLSHEIDTGRILFREETPIASHETVGDLHDRLMVAGSKLVLKTVDALVTGSVIPLDQEEVLSGTQDIRHAPKLFRDDIKIDWSKPVEAVRNHIRGLSPYPAAWTTLVNRLTSEKLELKVYYAEISEGTPDTPGTLRSDGKNYIKVACSDGWLAITDLRMEGKKRLKTGEFLRGFHNQGDFESLFYLLF